MLRCLAVRSAEILILPEKLEFPQHMVSNCIQINHVQYPYMTKHGDIQTIGLGSSFLFVFSPPTRHSVSCPTGNAAKEDVHRSRATNKKYVCMNVSNYVFMYGWMNGCMYV